MSFWHDTSLVDYLSRFIFILIHRSIFIISSVFNDIFLKHFAILEVTLKVTFVVSFEDEQATVALGTGFVVDKERGLILTNRHITGVGPVRALAIFDRHEELEVEVWSGRRKAERKTKWENSRET